MKDLDAIDGQVDIQYEREVENLLDSIIGEKKTKNISLDDLSKIDQLNRCFLERFSRQERKTAGSFYTNEALVIPTVERTLIPLVYRKKHEIKPPTSILELRVLDPAIGGFPVFLIVAIRVLSRLLFESLKNNGFLEMDSASKCVRIQSNEFFTFLSKSGYLVELKDKLFNVERISSILSVIIAQNCIYGVDIDPVAVKLARLNIIAEIGDITFDYRFLENNIKSGNSLISCWSNSFQRYPAFSLSRETGDEDHDPFHSYETGSLAKRLKSFRKNVFKGEYERYIQKCTSANSDEILVIEESLKAIKTTITEKIVKNRPFDWLERREEVIGDIIKTECYHEVEKSFDTWCSIWFWPFEIIERIPKPEKYFDIDKNDERVIAQLKKEHKFFHWELEFPEVFFREIRGFDAVLGNPPWETVKPHSREYFAKYDKGFWKYGKQEALKQQIKLFRDNSIIEREWLNYKARMKSLVNYFRNSAKKYPSSKTNSLSNNPYQLQGAGNLNNYRLFTEVALHIVNKRGRLGLILPAGIYSDLGSTALREFLMDHAQWEWLFSFENKQGIFPDIHRSYKFCLLIVALGGITSTIKTAFNNQNIDDWGKSSPEHVKLDVQSVVNMSPENRIINEINTENDARILSKIHSGTILLRNSSLKYIREYDMTNHSKLFPLLQSWKERGYQSSRYGYWENEEGKKALPLYEGRMIGQFQYSKKGWVKGKGRTADWREIKERIAAIEPQYLMSEDTHEKKGKRNSKLRITFIHVTAATNRRSMICSLNYGFPHGNSAPFLMINENKPEVTIPSLFYVAYFNSFCFDYVLRLKIAGINLNWFVLEECPLIDHEKIRNDVVDRISLLTARLNLTSVIYSSVWMYLRKRLLLEEEYGKQWANTRIERTRLRTIIDGIFAFLLGLSSEELAWILRSDSNNIKGFWRVDNTLPEHIRHPRLVMMFYQELEERGIDWQWEDWDFPPEINEEIMRSQEKNEEADSESYDWNKCGEQSKKILGPEKYSKLVENINNNKDPFKNMV